MRSRIRLILSTPLTVNVAAAALLRLAVPLTLAEGGERYRYYGMSLFFPWPGCPAFHCFRFLPPLLTSVVSSLLSLEVADAFIATGFLFQALAATALWYIAFEIHRSKRIAWWTVAWCWTTWGSIQSFSDPLLIADPVQAFWSFTALYLLLRQRYVTAVLMLLTGAAVKESVLLVPMIYAVYVFLSKNEARRRVVWLAVLVVLPVALWGVLRYWLHARYGYIVSEDQTYIRQTYLFGVWLPNLAPWPANLRVAALYIFGSFGAAWILGAFGLHRSGRAQRALSIAAVPAMVFLMVYQVPDRALATFPYAVLSPAAVYTAALPSAVAGLMLAANAAFTIRMNAAPLWLPRMPVLLVALAATTAAAAWTGRRRSSIDSPSVDDGSIQPRESTTVVWLARVALAATAAIALAVATRGLRHGPVVRLSLPTDLARIIDDDGATPGLAVSPDGGSIVFVGKHPPDVRLLWLRSIAASAAQPLDGTAGANAPFWSPDGRRIAFFAGGKLKIINLDTRRVVELADAPQPRGGAWNARGVILFAPTPEGGLYKVSSNGGDLTPATRPDEPARARSHRWPSFLPDNERFLFVKWSGSDEGLYLGSLASKQTVLLSRDTHGAVYADKLLLFAREKTLLVQPFDLRRVRMLGIPLRLGRAEMSETGRSAFAIGSRTVAVATETAQANLESGGRQLIWFDRSGQLLAPAGRSELANGVEISPDGRFAVMSVGNSGVDVPLWNLKGSPVARATFNAPAGRGPLWSPDGRFVVYARPTGDEAHRRWEFIERPAAGGPERLLASDLALGATPTSWSPDGRFLLYHARNASAGWDIWLLPVREGASAMRLVNGNEHAVQPQFSPDGKWIAYTSDETGQLQVWVEPYPRTGQRFMVTAEGGEQPRWRQDGKELFYVANRRFLMAVLVQTQPAFRSGMPSQLFEVKLPLDTSAFFDEYAVSRDGRFLINVSTAAEPSARVAVILNWKGALTSPE